MFPTNTADAAADFRRRDSLVSIGDLTEYDNARWNRQLMRQRSIEAMRPSYRVLLLGLVAIGCLVANGLLLAYPWDGYGGVMGMVKQAWVLAQGCLIALWAAASRRTWYVRLPALLIGTAWTWYLVMGPWVDGLKDPGFAVTLATQAVCILVIGRPGYLIWRQKSAAAEDPAPGGRLPSQFSLVSLLVWTTVLAVALALGRLVFLGAGWELPPERLEEILFFAVFGVYHGLYALLIFASLVGRYLLPVRIIAAVALIAGLAFAERPFFMSVFGTVKDADLTEFLVLAFVQTGYCLVVLVPLRIGGCFGSTRS